MMMLLMIYINKPWIVVTRQDSKRRVVSHGLSAAKPWITNVGNDLEAKSVFIWVVPEIVVGLVALNDWAAG
jgi:hypothetical protein